MGGATGIGLLLSRVISLPLSSLILAVNAFLFVWGTLVLGKKFALTTIVSTFAYPAFLSVAQMIPGITELTDNIMLATLYGGVLLGAGIGLIVKVGSSTGGTDILALIFHKWFHIPVAVLLYVVDFLVLGSQIFDSTSEQVLYGIMTLVLETVFMNRVMLLGKSQIQLFIISDKYEEIKERVLKDIDAGVTDGPHSRPDTADASRKESCVSYRTESCIRCGRSCRVSIRRHLLPLHRSMK